MTHDARIVAVVAVVVALVVVLAGLGNVTTGLLVDEESATADVSVVETSTPVPVQNQTGGALATENDSSSVNQTRLGAVSPAAASSRGVAP